MAIMNVGGKAGVKALLDKTQEIIKSGVTKDRKTLVDKKKVDQIKINEVSTLIEKLGKTSNVTSDNIVNILQYLELVEELKTTHG